jgi:hypothetical protein
VQDSLPGAADFAVWWTRTATRTEVAVRPPAAERIDVPEPQGPGYTRYYALLVASVVGVSAAGTVLFRGQPPPGGDRPSEPRLEAPARTGAEPELPAPAAPVSARVLPAEGYVPALSLLTQFVSTPSLVARDTAGRYVTGPHPRLAHVPPDVDPARLAWDVAQAARLEAEARQIAVTFLIVTLPDYIDAGSAWNFDPLLDAVQRGVVSDGYTLDSFIFPDWSPVGNVGADRREPGARRIHEVAPAAVLFRKHADGTRDTQLLLVLVVGETATFGVHRQAFDAAMQLVALWDPTGPVRILGPSFSGSAVPLRAAISDALGSYWRYVAVPVQVVSGSATSRANRDLLTFTPNPLWDVAELGPQVTFEATVRADDDLIGELMKALGRLNPRWADGGRDTAVLVEANTFWGNQLSAAHVFANALRISFPLHISRLRSAAPATPAPGLRLELPGAGVSLSLREQVPPIDRLPSFTPELTSANVETALAAVLRAVEDAGVTAVGIFATDKRDHVFLAQEIARRVPNVLQFTVEPDLIFEHPDVKAYVRGTLVGSSYSLFDRTQLLVRPEVGRVRRLQFVSMAAHGVYNAALVLLGRPDLLLDYDSPVMPLTARPVGARAPPSPCAPGRIACQPPIWVSVVGRDALWPLWVSEPPAAAEAGPPAPRVAGAAAAPGDPALGPPETSPDGGAADGAAAIRPAAAPATGAYAFLARAASGPALPQPLEEPAPFLQGRLAVKVGALLAAVIAAFHLLLVPALVAGRNGRPAGWYPHGLAGTARAFEPPRWQPALRPGGAEPSRRDRRRLALLRHEYAVSVYACTGALVLLLFWTAQLSAVWAADAAGQRPDAWLPMLAWGRLATAGLLTAAAAPVVWIGGSITLASFRSLPISLGLAALWSLHRYLSDDRWQGTGALLQVDRAGTLWTLVSPTPVILIFAMMLYWWGLWNARRIHALEVPYARDSGTLGLLRRRAFVARVPLEPALYDPALTSGALVAIPLAAAAFPVLTGLSNRFTVDGEAFGWFVWLGSLCLLVVLAHTMAHSLRLGHALLRLLRSVERHPVAAAFEAVGREPLPWRLSLTPLDARDLEPLARRAHRFAAALARLPAAVVAGGRDATPAAESGRAADARLEPGGPVRVERRRAPILPADPPTPQARAMARQLDVRATDVVDLEALGGLPETIVQESRRRASLQEARIWRTVDRASGPLVRALARRHWKPVPASAASSPEHACYEEASVLVAFQMAIIVRDVLTRVVSGFTLALVGFVAVMLAHLQYAFQGRQYWLTLDWAYLGIGTVLVLALLVALEKDVLLSRLWGTQPGRISWTGGFALRMAGYAAVGLITMIATFFPEVGSTLVAWLEPVRKAIP